MYIYVCVQWGISPLSKTLALSLFCEAPHKLENFESSPPPSPSPLADLFLCISVFCKAL